MRFSSLADMLGRMSYRWVEHAGELELEIEAATEEGVLSDALTAIAELLDEDSPGARLRREIAASGRERALQLVEWLGELVDLAETESLVAEEVERRHLPAAHIRSPLASSSNS
jgi:SHS2 domain-containing protein